MMISNRVVEEGRRSQLRLIVAGFVGVFLLYSTSFFVPMAIMLLASTGDAGIGVSEYSGLEAYREFLGSSYYREILLDSVQLAVVTTVVAALVSFPLAHLLVRGSKLVKAVTFVAVLSPLFVSVVVRAFGLELFLRRLGIENSGTAVVIGLVQVLLPFMVLPLAASFRELDPLLVTAARTLGAGRIRTAFQVSLPALMPGVVAGAVLVFVLALNNFAIPTILGRPDDPVIAQVIYQSATTFADFTLASAIAITILAFVVVLLAATGRLGSRNPNLGQRE